MPIPIDGSAWKDGKQSRATSAKIIQLLSSQPNKAFSLREIADDVVGTSWNIAMEREELIQEVGKDEYYKNREKYQDQLSGEEGSTTWDIALIVGLEIKLDDLVQQELVEQRHVSGDDLDIPYEWENVTYYTYALE